MENVSWKLIDKYFKNNPYNLVSHHLDSYNEFFNRGINQIFRENNPFRFIEREEKENPESRNEVLLYLGGKNGDKIYFGKPIIYDDNYAHYMYPNDARLRNMTYGITIHYDVDVDFIFYEAEEEKRHSITLEKIYLGRFPIMLQSNMCILKDLPADVRFNMGECKNDYGGYFIIDGKEKAIVSQEKFADNMLYIRINKSDNIYSHSAEIRSVSEDASKPIRTTSVKIVAPLISTKQNETVVLSNNQIVVAVPNVRKPVPLFILMRALGIISDKNIIEYCLLDLEKNSSYIDLFIPCIHDANKIFTQEIALKYIATFTKRGTITGVLDILMNFFLPHIGVDNLLDKAYFIGYMVNRLLRVYTKEDKPTDRDNFRFKRVELSGALIYDLFREYHLIFKRHIELKIDTENYKNKGIYKRNFIGLIENNYVDIFKERVIDVGFKKAFKGNWGAEAHTKRLGAIQDLNRLSWNTFISQLRKFNLPLDASAKVVGPRLLHSSQWGYIDPVDTPDGGNIGLHKHMAISTHVTSGFSSFPIIQWMRAKTSLKILQECNPLIISENSKVFVNGNWIGVIDNPIETIKMFKLFRRNGLIPVYTSISFHYEMNEIFIYTDSGRLSRPIYYIDDDKKISYNREDVIELINSGNFTWEEMISGLKKKSDESYSSNNNKIYDIDELYPSLKSLDTIEKEFEKNKAVVDYIDTAEEEGLMIANNIDDLKNNRFYTNVEIDPSLILGVMGNLIVYPENNPYPRNAFSCGQSKQAVSVYHTNYQMRMDKMGVILNYGQIPLLKSRYLEYFNKEEQPYGVNTIVAIMSYTGYNVEDAILINEGSIKRGMFRTTYYSTYESREESANVGDSTSNSIFSNVSGKNVVGIKKGYDYSHLDKWGLVKENTELNETTVVIGKITSNSEDSEVSIDSSVFPKKGQLGFVDKSFITEGEEGFRIAKIRVREERIPAIGDKFASRCGQKGTIGIIIPETDMPFTKDGIRPDIIINPHALPSRMTIGQLIESLFGKACSIYGGFGDCTAFATKGPNTKLYGSMLVNAGFHSSGNEIMYNGMSGEQLYSEIFMGPTYYMRLKHMVKDKINARALGPRTALTRQTVQGRANEGGLRIGEMERDGILAHGASAFLNESFMIRGDEYFMAVCNKSGSIAIYNNSLNLFLSPFVDGPIHFNTGLDGKQIIQNISRFGRSFSIVRIPYSLKLLIQELQVMNVQMRIITEDNIDQLTSMSYSDNVNKLLKNESSISNLYTEYKNDVSTKIRESVETTRTRIPKEEPILPSFEVSSPQYAPGSPEESPQYNPRTPEYAQTSPQYNPNTPEYSPGSPAYAPNSSSSSIPYAPGSPAYPSNSSSSSIPYAPGSPAYPPNTSDYSLKVQVKNPELKSQYEALPEEEKLLLAKMIATKKVNQQKEGEIVKDNTNILEIEEKKESNESKSEGGNESESGIEGESGSENSKKIINFDLKPEILDNSNQKK